MATRLYAWGPGQLRVQEGVGDAASSQVINMTVDLATNLVNEGGSTRGLERQEVIEFLEAVRKHIMTGNWPPA